jgi:phosphopantothenoylcysteine decarboxylase/phosphopantothenate--cysteine ligase
MKLKGKRIVLGVTGGIAAYKAAELLRLLMQEGADVRVVMTRAAARFVAPLTFRALWGHPVLTSLWAGDGAPAGESDDTGVDHIEIIKDADLVVVAPATANTLAKAAWGLADDALSTVLVAAGTEILWAPAMNHRMWKNPITQDNLARLRRLGHQVVDPEEGWMACREDGIGRMADPAAILGRVVELIGSPQDLAGVRVLVTAGRTEEPLDSVRVITNRSSGKMGVALAEEALARGAHVTLLAGPMDVPPPEGVSVERIGSASELAAAAERLFAECDVLVMAAAVGDFRAAKVSPTKIRRGKGNLDLTLKANPDILTALAGQRREGQILVGFALETENPQEKGREKLERKDVDLIVVNNPNVPGAAIGGDTNVVWLLERGKTGRRLPVLPKREVAQRILDWVVARRSVTPRRTSGERSTRRARGAQH